MEQQEKIKENLSKITKIINEWKLNKTVLSKKMNMPVGTFKNKLNEKQTAYKFTEAELDSLTVVLQMLVHDVCKLDGIGYTGKSGDEYVLAHPEEFGLKPGDIVNGCMIGRIPPAGILIEASAGKCTTTGNSFIPLGYPKMCNNKTGSENFKFGPISAGELPDTFIGCGPAENISMEGEPIVGSGEINWYTATLKATGKKNVFLGIFSKLKFK